MNRMIVKKDITGDSDEAYRAWVTDLDEEVRPSTLGWSRDNIVRN